MVAATNGMDTPRSIVADYVDSLDRRLRADVRADVPEGDDSPVVVFVVDGLATVVVTR